MDLGTLDPSPAVRLILCDGVSDLPRESSLRRKRTPALGRSGVFVAVLLLTGEEMSWAGEASPSAKEPAATSAKSPRFEAEILPILTAHCFKCHGLEARQANLDLRTPGLMRQGGDSGPVLVPGSTDESLLWTRLADRSMPPEKELPLGDAKLELIRAWIAAGAPAATEDEPAPPAAAVTIPPEAREFWAFRRLATVQVPAVDTADQAPTPVDSFIVTRLAEKGLALAPFAERPALARRLWLDLTGLPPTVDELQSFLNDAAPDAWERRVDALLASPHFGERWGRHWLDAAGYCDVIGDDTDRDIVKNPDGKWRYRDWVVQAVNDDKPYDRFLIEQLAGDELVDWRNAASLTPETRDLLVATGFLRTAPDETLQNELNTADIRHQVLAQTVEVVASNLLGLTLQCARCHSHKYDPIPQEDYYRLMAVFTPAFNPAQWLQPGQREIPDVSAVEKAAIDADNAARDAQIADLRRQQAEIRQPTRTELEAERLAALPAAIREDTAAAIRTPADQRTEVQRYLADKFASEVQVDDATVDARLPDESLARVRALAEEIAAQETGRRRYGRLQAVYDVAAPPPTYLLRRGNHENPGTLVAPGVLRVLCDAEDEALLVPEAPSPATSGRRFALARRLTDPTSRAGALLARVYVNRVWQHLFGRGLVASSDNFGQSGTPPTHPELLDWLAQRFIADGWRTKPLVRLLVTSAVYRQSTAALPAVAERAERLDPANDGLWRMRLRQLESEAVRDSVLAVSGRLDRTLGGPPVGLVNAPDGSVLVAASGAQVEGGKVFGTPGAPGRRSLYVLTRRRYNLSVLDAFDQPEMARNCVSRGSSAVVTQSLSSLNDAFWQEHAAAFAGQVALACGSSGGTTNPVAAIRAAYLRALCREPKAGEVELSRRLLEFHVHRAREGGADDASADQEALAHLCHMLLCANEFLYIP